MSRLKVMRGCYGVHGPVGNPGILKKLFFGDKARFKTLKLWDPCDSSKYPCHTFVTPCDAFGNSDTVRDPPGLFAAVKNASYNWKPAISLRLEKTTSRSR